MDCEDARYNLFLFLDGEGLPSDTEQQLQDHLASCKSFQAFQQLLTHTDRLLWEAVGDEYLPSSDPLVVETMRRLDGCQPVAVDETGGKGVDDQVGAHVSDSEGSASGSGAGDNVNPFQRAAHFLLEHPLAAIIVIALLTGIGWGGNNVLQELVRLRHDAREKQAEYDEAWKAVGFDKIVEPAISVFAAQPGGRRDSILVELSPRVEHGWIREVKVHWGDLDAWEWIFEAEGNAKALAATHAYALPPEDKIREWTLQIEYTVSDAVATARRFTRDELTRTCVVRATRDGIALLPSDGKSPKPRLVEPGLPRISWLSPAMGAAAGWKTTVVLKSSTPTERVTLLVRPCSGSTFYVLAGARPLSAERSESFEVKLGGRRGDAIGDEFQIFAVANDNFMPSEWSLDISEVPHASVVGRVTVRKVAGMISADPAGVADQESARIRGEIFTSDGAAVLVKQGQEFTVLETFAPALVGSRFDKTVRVPPPGPRAIHMVVYRKGAPALRVGQKITDIPAESYWLYSAATSQVRRESLEQGD
ncbi:MAG: zf-HC2 domain-containing protein [Planctomycetes bacterium]|nr:zf-HC2 domain-containing protein [Planctomycetota bacterium]